MDQLPTYMISQRTHSRSEMLALYLTASLRRGWSSYIRNQDTSDPHAFWRSAAVIMSPVSDELGLVSRAELEAAIAASLAQAEADGARPGGAPPAAKFAVRALRTEVLTAEGLAALGAGVECCVCRCTRAHRITEL